MPGSPSFSIRSATEHDNQALLELTRACPMEGEVSLSIGREPDFFSLSRARGNGSTYVVESEGQIVACGSVCRRTAHLHGEAGQMGYIGDIKVAPHFQRRGLAQRVMNTIAEGEAAREPAPYVGSVALGNTATDAMTLRFGEQRTLCRLTTFTCYQLLPLVRMRVSSSLEIGVAGPGDEAELIELLDSYHRQLTFSPVFRHGGFRETLDRMPGMDLSSYRIARRRGRLVAAAAVWDERGVKQTTVRTMTTRLRLISRLMRAAGKILPLPPFPAEGERLRFLYLRHTAHADGEPMALAALVRSIVNEVSRTKVHFLLFTCADDDPAVACIRGIPRTRYHYSLVAGTNSPDYEEQLRALCNARAYDDAALS